MSRVCEYCGKGSQHGNKVSNSYIHTRKTWKPNLVEIKTVENGTTVTRKICTRCLRTSDALGVPFKKVTVPTAKTETQAK